MKGAIAAGRLLAVMAAAALAVTVSARAAGATERAAEKPMVYALVSAVGDQFSYVRQRQQVGTNLEPYGRTLMKVPDDALNAAVLRGLDRVIAERDPDSTRIFLKLNPLEMDNVPPKDRESVAIGKLASALEKVPGRAEWDRIIIVTPTYLLPGREGLGAKLQGIGVFVQPVRSSRIAGPSATLDIDRDGSPGPEAVAPGGTVNRSRRFIAPFFYTRLWVLDAKTLAVLETESRYDYSRLFDPESPAIDVAKSLTPDQLGEQVVRFVERSSAKALREAVPVVTVGDPVVVEPAK
jgi:hypothetical protein